ncbi:MAG TPA: ferric reductase-like transmembrane domain-containing protein [Trebonia sp.]|jgi:predicted ferric reductase|nr:ferric reductase-like transmembrane domain-containing protein [Trebonia sp.]
MSNSTTFWYASRATGVVALVLLSVVLALGIAVARQARVPGLPRFALTELHRNLSLLAVAFLSVHVLTAVLDTYVAIPLAAIVIPFASGYERLWLGLGAAALDLTAAMIVTSLLRGRMSRAAWRAVHLAVYLCWPLALVHSLFSDGDMRHGPLLGAAIACALAVAAAIARRLAGVARRPARAARVAAELAVAERGRAAAPASPAAHGSNR